MSWYTTFFGTRCICRCIILIVAIVNCISDEFMNMNMNSSAVVNVTFWVAYNDENTSVEVLVNHWFVLYAVMKKRLLRLW